MATATETEVFAEQTKKLVAALREGPKPLASLPKECQDVEFLEHALADKRILFGRPSHSWEHAPGVAESHSERPKRLVVGKSVEWTSLDKPWHQSVYELLADEANVTDPKLKLQVKLARRTN